MKKVKFMMSLYRGALIVAVAVVSAACFVCAGYGTNEVFKYLNTGIPAIVTYVIAMIAVEACVCILLRLSVDIIVESAGEYCFSGADTIKRCCFRCE